MEGSCGEYYDFEIVNYHERNEKEYLTVSKRGLTMFQEGKPPTFISVEQWEREAHIYRKMRRIAFFKLFH